MEQFINVIIARKALTFIPIQKRWKERLKRPNIYDDLLVVHSVRDIVGYSNLSRLQH